MSWVKSVSTLSAVARKATEQGETSLCFCSPLRCEQAASNEARCTHLSPFSCLGALASLLLGIGQRRRSDTGDLAATSTVRGVRMLVGNRPGPNVRRSNFTCRLHTKAHGVHGSFAEVFELSSAVPYA